MAFDTIYEAARIPESERARIAAFTRQSMIGVARGSLRAELVSLGYDDRRITLRDPGLLKIIDQHANDQADSIISTTSQMLRSRLDALPDDATQADAQRTVDTFWRAARTYNKQTLVPYTTDSARSYAQTALYTKNKIKATFRVEPPSTDSTDDCTDAIAAGTVDFDASQQWPLPAHPRCPHRWARVSVDTSTLPSSDSVWDGS